MQFSYNKVILIVALAVLTLGVTGCTFQKKTTIDTSTNPEPMIVTEDALDAGSAEGMDTTTSSSTTDTDGDTSVSVSTDIAVGVKEFSITAKNWEFIPGEITVNKGDRVRLKIASVDVDHGFAIAAFNVNQKLTPGKTEIVEFTADKSGSYTFFCSVFCGGGHREMKGTLIVK